MRPLADRYSGHFPIDHSDPAHALAVSKSWYYAPIPPLINTGVEVGRFQEEVTHIAVKMWGQRSEVTRAIVIMGAPVARGSEKLQLLHVLAAEQ